MEDLFTCFDKAYAYISANPTLMSNVANWGLIGATLQAVFASSPDAGTLGVCTFSTFLNSGADCGNSAGPNDVCWMLQVSTKTSLSPKCTSSLIKDRCAQSSISVAVYETLASSKAISCPSTPLTRRASLSYSNNLFSSSLTTAFNASDPDLCGGDYLSGKTVLGSSCLAVDVNICQSTDGGSSYCVKASSSSSWAPSTRVEAIGSFSIPGLWFGPTVLEEATNTFRRNDMAKTCSPWPLNLPLDTSNNGIVLGPLVQKMFTFVNDYTLSSTTSLRSYFIDSTIGLYYNNYDFQSVNDVAAAERVVLGSSPLAIYWSTNLVYCEKIPSQYHYFFFHYA
jgi:hypothetical protein